ncbi:MAG: cyclic nucleotide-binding domain-containing protein [Mariprofundaceae bacterium]|nr:cyclic nucleotide-binding domain-containing protein [Mariprofundaceae bacterium]
MITNVSKDIVLAAIQSGNFVLAAHSCVKLAQTTKHDGELWQMAGQLCNQAALSDSAAQCYSYGARVFAAQKKIPQAVNMMKHYVDYHPEENERHTCRHMFHACRAEGGVNCTLCAEELDSTCQLFRAHPFWSTFPDSLLTSFLRSVHVQHYTTGECIAQEEDDANSILLVTKGKIQPYFNDVSGKNTVSTIDVGSICGDIPYHFGLNHRVYSLVAAEDCEAIEVPYAALRQLVKKVPAIQEWVENQFNEHVLEHMLTNIPFFSSLPGDVIRQTCQQMELLHIPGETTLFEQGERENLDMYVLKSGWMSLNYRWHDREYHLCTLKAGDTCGELGILENKRKITIRAITKIELLRWPEAAFKHSYQQHYSLRDHVLVSMGRYQSVMDNIQQNEHNPNTTLSHIDHDTLLRGMFCSQRLENS